MLFLIFDSIMFPAFHCSQLCIDWSYQLLYFESEYNKNYLFWFFGILHLFLKHFTYLFSNCAEYSFIISFLEDEMHIFDIFVNIRVNNQSICLLSSGCKELLLVEKYFELNVQRSHQTINYNHWNLSELIFEIVIALFSPFL